MTYNLNSEKVINLISKKIAVILDTEEKEKAFLQKTQELRIDSWEGNWDMYKEHTCYTLRDKEVTYSSVSWYTREGYEIIDIDSLLEEPTYNQDTTQVNDFKDYINKYSEVFQRGEKAVCTSENYTVDTKDAKDWLKSTNYDFERKVDDCPSTGDIGEVVIFAPNKDNTKIYVAINHEESEYIVVHDLRDVSKVNTLVSEEDEMTLSVLSESRDEIKSRDSQNLPTKKYVYKYNDSDFCFVLNSPSNHRNITLVKVIDLNEIQEYEEDLEYSEDEEYEDEDEDEDGDEDEKLEVGDRIIVTDISFINNKSGTIDHISTMGMYGIIFDEYMDGHTLDGKCKYGYGWYCRRNAITKIN